MDLQTSKQTRGVKCPRCLFINQKPGVSVCRRCKALILQAATEYGECHMYWWLITTNEHYTGCDKYDALAPVYLFQAFDPGFLRQEAYEWECAIRAALVKHLNLPSAAGPYCDHCDYRPINIRYAQNGLHVETLILSRFPTARLLTWKDVFGSYPPDVTPAVYKEWLGRRGRVLGGLPSKPKRRLKSSKRRSTWFDPASGFTTYLATPERAMPRPPGGTVWLHTPPGGWTVAETAAEQVYVTADVNRTLEVEEANFNDDYDDDDIDDDDIDDDIRDHNEEEEEEE